MDGTGVECLEELEFQFPLKQWIDLKPGETYKAIGAGGADITRLT